MSMTEQLRSADGSVIAYERAGHGPGLVLVDGALASRSSFPTAEGLPGILADDRTVVSYDRRGRGDSGPDGPTPGRGNVEAEIADLAALLGTVDQPTGVCGFSSGATLALRAAMAGTAIDRFALYEPPFVVSDDRAPVALDYAEQLAGHLVAGDPDSAITLFLTQTVGVPAAHVEGMRQSPHWPAMTAVAASLPYDAAVMGTTMSGDAAELDGFASVTVPTLVLYGGESPAWLRAAAQRLADLLPDAELLEIPGQDHMVTAAALAPVLRDFLATGRAR